MGPGVSPKAALAVGLKVDVEALPQSLGARLAAGRVDLDDPATTLALLRLNAVVGVKGFFDAGGELQSIGHPVRLCHSTVDDSLAPGIGRRLDGWANRDLNVGAIVALAPELEPLTDLLGVDEATVSAVLAAGGRASSTPQLFLDGKGFRPDGKTAATLIPPAFGLAGVNLHTLTGWGSVPYWNAFVANLEMHGKGTFFDPRLNDPVKFPVAARRRVLRRPQHTRPGHAEARRRSISTSSRLPAPKPPAGSFDPAAAEARARRSSPARRSARTATCRRSSPSPAGTCTTPAEVGIDDFQADRSPDGRYRTTPLKGLLGARQGRLLPRRPLREARATSSSTTTAASASG